MRLGRFAITTWDKKEPGIIWFEAFSADCNCKFLTICNILFVYYGNDDCYGMNRRKNE